MHKIIYRFSYLSAVIEGAKKGNLIHGIAPYLVNSRADFLERLDLNKIPNDYNGDNYDLIFDANGDFIRAEKDLDITDNLK